MDRSFEQDVADWMIRVVVPSHRRHKEFRVSTATTCILVCAVRAGIMKRSHAEALFHEIERDGWTLWTVGMLIGVAHALNPDTTKDIGVVAERLKAAHC